VVTVERLDGVGRGRDVVTAGVLLDSPSELPFLAALSTLFNVLERWALLEPVGMGKSEGGTEVSGLGIDWVTMGCMGVGCIGVVCTGVEDVVPIPPKGGGEMYTCSLTLPYFSCRRTSVCEEPKPSG